MCRLSHHADDDCILPILVPLLSGWHLQLLRMFAFAFEPCTVGLALFRLGLALCSVAPVASLEKYDNVYETFMERHLTMTRHLIPNGGGSP